MIDVEQAAVQIAAATLGRDPGPLAAADSLSHNVFVGADIVVKIIEAVGHSRLDREIALAPHLPAGVTAPLLAAGFHEHFRYACYARASGSTPGMGLPGADAAAVRSLAEQAVHRLDVLHRWQPYGEAGRTLRSPLDHGGFTGREAFAEGLDRLAAADWDGVVRPPVLAGLRAIAAAAPARLRTDVPVHADCHWGNWLVSAGRVTALLDFEWARFGDPLDDWFFVIADSGPLFGVAVEVMARETGIAPEVLRARCEVMEAAYVVSDIRMALGGPAFPAERLRRLEEVVIDRAWWR